MSFLIQRLQYQPLQNKLLGKGAYGYVCAVKNAETGERLAVKKVKKAFEDLVDAKRVLREISMDVLYYSFIQCSIPLTLPCL